MTKEQIQNFTVRIANCNKTELVVVTYDIILTYMEEAENSYHKGDVENFLFNIKKARQYVNNLTSTLNLDYSISLELLRLYMFIDKSLFTNIIKKQPVNMECMTDMVQKLKAAFIEVAKEDKTGALLNNTSEVYAGYTYSRGNSNNINLNEMVMR